MRKTWSSEKRSQDFRSTIVQLQLSKSLSKLHFTAMQGKTDYLSKALWVAYTMFYLGSPCKLVRWPIQKV